MQIESQSAHQMLQTFGYFKFKKPTIRYIHSAITLSKRKRERISFYLILTYVNLEQKEKKYFA